MAEEDKETKSVVSADQPEPEEAGKAEPDDDISIPQEILEKLPERPRRVIQRMISMMGFSGPIPHPLTEKLTEEHITKIIECGARDDEREFQNTKDERKTYLIIFFAVLISIVGLTVFFTILQETEVLVPLIAAIVAFGGGYGFGKSRRRV